MFELFQDLEAFSLEDYEPFADVSSGVDRIVRFLGMASEEKGGRLDRVADDLYELRRHGESQVRRFTTRREPANGPPDVDLLGLDHAVVEEALAEYRALPPEEVGVSVEGESASGVVTFWVVQSHGKKGEKRMYLRALGIDSECTRSVALERNIESLFTRPATSSSLSESERRMLLSQHIEPMLRRELLHRGIIDSESGYSADLIGWVELRGTTSL